jgi:proline iminopeptidase
MRNRTILFVLLFFTNQIVLYAQRNYMSHLRDKMCGYHHLEVGIVGANGELISSKGHAVFCSKLEDRYLQEDFEFELNGKKIFGTAYITYSEFYNRFELMQVDNASKSSILLYSETQDSVNSSISFVQPLTSNMWGLSNNIKVKWKYNFKPEGNFTKEIWLVDGEKEKLSSSYAYKLKLEVEPSVKWEKHVINQSDGKLTYYTIGSGKPILIINGGPGWSCEHIKPFAEKLNPKVCKVIVFDQRGTGSSRLATEDSLSITLAKVTNDIELIRKDLQLKSWDIIGHSFGAMIAMNYVANYPKTISKLILMAPGGANLGFLETYQYSLNARLSEQNMNDLTYWTKRADKQPETASLNIIYNTLPAFLYHDSLVNGMMDFIDPLTWNMQTASLMWTDLSKINFDVSKKLKSYYGKTLILQGDQDALGNNHPLVLATYFNKAQVKMLNECAHILWVDQMGKTISIINEFLN